MAVIAQWLRLCLPSCSHGFRSQANRLSFFNLYYWNCNEKRKKINKKRPWMAHFLKNRHLWILFRFSVLSEPSTSTCSQTSGQSWTEIRDWSKFRACWTFRRRSPCPRSCSCTWCRSRARTSSRRPKIWTRGCCRSKKWRPECCCRKVCPELERLL